MGSDDYKICDNRRDAVFYRIRKTRLYLFAGLFAVVLVVVGLTSGLLSARYWKDRAQKCAQGAKIRRSTGQAFIIFTFVIHI